ncbi:amidohydrolase family protein [Paracandidimonas soli]|nr:amidohydrolase family protein [Paracandidimonas soli]
MHIFDNRYPFAPVAPLKHGDASPSQYRKLQQRLGLQRMVVVQPSSYGTDHRVLLNALSCFGPAAKGIGVITPETDAATLRQLTDANVVGARLNLVQKSVTDTGMLDKLAPVLRMLGWHLQVHLPPQFFIRVINQLIELKIDVVMDHFAGICHDESLKDRVDQGVLRLMDSGHGWLKLSGAYMMHPSPPHTSAMLDSFVSKLVARYPDRLVWGSDWPHVTEREKPDDAKLLDLFARWVPDPGIRHAILVENPRQLYRYHDSMSTRQ